jgi:MFS family permease
MYGSLRFMALGLFIFGLGVSPVSVIQETIIVRFFKSHGLGVTMAMGLFAGRAASFLAARTAYPLSENFGPRAPFYVATALAAFSVVVNLIYISLSRRLVDLAGAELEATDISSDAQRRLTADAAEEVAKKHQVHIHQIVRLGDIFWAYVQHSRKCRPPR